MNNQEIVIEIDKNTGDSKIEAVNFQGQGCISATKPFEDGLGKGDRTLKPQYNQQQAGVRLSGTVIN